MGFEKVRFYSKNNTISLRSSQRVIRAYLTSRVLLRPLYIYYLLGETLETSRITSVSTFVKMHTFMSWGIMRIIHRDSLQCIAKAISFTYSVNCFIFLICFLSPFAESTTSTYLLINYTLNDDFVQTLQRLGQRLSLGEQRFCFAIPGSYNPVPITVCYYLSVPSGYHL